MAEYKTLFKMKVNGKELTEGEMADIHSYYERCCTASYLLDNYEEITDEDTAFDIACSVRDDMDAYDMSETDAIEHVLKDRGIL